MVVGYGLIDRNTASSGRGIRLDRQKYGLKWAWTGIRLDRLKYGLEFFLFVFFLWTGMRLDKLKYGLEWSGTGIQLDRLKYGRVGDCDTA